MRTVAWIVCASVLCASTAASAQPADPPPDPPAEAAPASPAELPPDTSPAPVAAPALSDPRTDAGWQLYHAALASLLRGKRREAAGLVAQLQREHPGHPAAVATASTSLIAAPLVADVTTSGAPVEQPSKGARAELALFQTIHGIVIGGELCVLMDCDSGGGILGLLLLGGVGGSIASLVQDDLTSGQRALVNGGTFWGFANAGLLMIAVEPDDYKAVVLALMGGQLGGLALGAGLHYLRPTAGQVGIANSGGQWALALTGLSILAADPDMDSSSIALMLLVAMDAGLGAGAYIAKTFPRISRGRGWVIDAGGIVGAVGGGGIGVLVSGDVSERGTPALAAAGAVVGLGVAAYLTRNWDADDDPGVPAAMPVIGPVAQGRGATLGLAVQW